MTWTGVYLFGFVTTAALQLVGASAAREKGHDITWKKDARLIALNSVLWFVFLPLVYYSRRKQRQQRATGVGAASLTKDVYALSVSDDQESPSQARGWYSAKDLRNGRSQERQGTAGGRVSMADEQEGPAEKEEGVDDEEGRARRAGESAAEEAGLTLRQAIETKLDHMLEAGRPAMWGSPEAFELQALLLLDLLYPDSEPLAWRLCLFLAPRHDELGCRPLSAITSDYDLLTRELRAFRAHLAGMGQAPAL